jgi:hypothetical protein
MLAVLVAVFHSVAAIEGARPSLHTLMTVAKSDKATVHQYTLHYEWLLGHLRDAPINFLEIGVLQEHSLKGWDQYFSRANVYGADRGHYKSNRILWCDQSNLTSIQQLAKLRTWDVIIDDASHIPSHQLSTFLTLFPKLSAGGIYIIEEIETSYWADSSRLYGYDICSSKPCTESIVQQFAAAVDLVNRPTSSPSGCRLHGHRDVVFTPEIDAMIGSVSFIHNAVIVRKHPDGHTPRSGRYRMEGCICGHGCNMCQNGCLNNG